eukprot:c16630_g2_i1.p1 GENE.c16630_g2_i1~~c16630_g2_i1.p1  ORF type:complete len:142 (+),score=9.20 c16630_g2_i1:410-835(+)
MKDNVLEEARLSKQYGLPFSDATGLQDICASYDGSWSKRKHSSLLGFGFLIGRFTGRALASAVRSKHCPTCIKNQRSKKPVREHNCCQNYPSEKSAGSMEPDIALELQRKVAEYGARLAVFVGDGDTEALSLYPDYLFNKQ